MAPQQFTHDDYTVGWICALPDTELVAAGAALDIEHPVLAAADPKDTNVYLLGSIGQHNVVIACLPAETTGKVSAATVAKDMLRSFKSVRFGLMVGIGGGAPYYGDEDDASESENEDSEPEDFGDIKDVRLGDVVIGLHSKATEAVVQYDFGKSVQKKEFIHTGGRLNKPPPLVLSAVSMLRSQHRRKGQKIPELLSTMLSQNLGMARDFSHPGKGKDKLFKADVVHLGGKNSCKACRGPDDSNLVKRKDRPDNFPHLHYGTIGSADQVMKDAILRDKLARQQNIMCFEMEAAGLMDSIPCLVIRGICDYADSHKNKRWQPYAAAVAATYAKELLSVIPAQEVKNLSKLGELLKDVLSVSRETNAVSLDTRAALQGMQVSSHFNTITQWLSAPDPSTNLNNARALHERGTGQWLLESDKYRSWKADPGSFLWLVGDAGCGKTILSSTVVADFAGDTTTSQSLLYFYFDFGNKDKRSTEGAVRSLIDQLYRKRIETRAVVDSLYATYEKDGGQPTYASLEKALQDMIAKCSSTWIVLDGVDECEGRDARVNGSVLTWIENLRHLRRNAHILVTSRPERDIESSFEKWLRAGERITLQSGLVRDDIAAYINAEVDRMDRWREDREIQELMVTTLNKGANGMFRWVACQFDTLNRCISRPNIRKELKSLPRTLYDTYTQMFERIYPGHRSDAIRLLQLLTYSPRPLRIEEVVDAIAVDPESAPAFDPEDRIKPPEAITQYCSGFVSLTTHFDARKKSDVTEIQLAHFSVQEYFRSDRLPPDLAAQLGKTAAAESLVDLCLSYLPELDTSLSVDKAKEQYPFAEFSAQYWADYAVIVEASSQQVPKAVKEYYTRRDAFILGYKIYHPDCEQWEHYNKEASPLYYASLAGLSASVRMLLEADANTNVQCGYLGNALQAASEGGHHGIVQTLIQHGADVNAQGGFYGNALTAASAGGHESIVQTIIQHGADVNAQGEDNGNALYAASFRSHDYIMQTLMQHGADVNAQGGFYGNALTAASLGGYEGIVQTLMQHGADVNAQGGRYGNALQAASLGGHHDIVQILIQHGANVHAQGGKYGHALQAASLGGHDGIVQTLIQDGANVHARGGKYGHVLQAALERGYQGVVQTLIQHGADVNAQGGAYGNALFAASVRGHQGVVQTLIQHGADVNAQGGEYGNALFAALVRGHQGVVQLLFESGAVMEHKMAK